MNLMNADYLLPGAIILEGHVQGLSNLRSLGELGIPVYVVDQNRCLAQYSKYCTAHFVCPPFTSDNFPDFLIDLAIQKGIHGWLLMASNDHIVEQLSRYRVRLAPYYKMLVPDPVALKHIIDKRLLMQEAQACGVKIPMTYDCNNLPDFSSLRFPLLVKGSQGLTFYKKTHKKAIQINTPEELKVQLSQLSNLLTPAEFMIQELIQAQEKDRVISFTCFADKGQIKTYWMGRKLREHPIQYGTATFAESLFDNHILNEAIPLVRHLGYTGICEIEFLKDSSDGNYKLIEINPRTWLWVGLAKDCGIDYAKVAYRYVNGQPQTYPDHYEIGRKWINRLTDLVYAVKALCAKKISVKDYIDSLRGKKSFAIWNKKDPLPGLVFPFLSLYIARKRR